MDVMLRMMIFICMRISCLWVMNRQQVGSTVIPTQRKKKAGEAWAEVQQKIVPAMVSASGFPKEDLCVLKVF